MKASLVLFGIAVGLASLMGGSPAAGEEGKSSLAKPVLSKPYTPVLGEMIASTISGVLATAKASDSPLSAAYDRQLGKIVVVMMGTHGSVDGAKAAVDNFRKNAMPVIADAIGKQYGVALDEDSQLLLVYQNRSKAYAEVVRRENGQYVVK